MKNIIICTVFVAIISYITFSVASQSFDLLAWSVGHAEGCATMFGCLTFVGIISVTMVGDMQAPKK